MTVSIRYVFNGRTRSYRRCREMYSAMAERTNWRKDSKGHLGRIFSVIEFESVNMCVKLSFEGPWAWPKFVVIKHLPMNFSYSRPVKAWRDWTSVQMTRAHFLMKLSANKYLLTKVEVHFQLSYSHLRFFVKGLIEFRWDQTVVSSIFGKDKWSTRSKFAHTWSQ